MHYDLPEEDLLHVTRHTRPFWAGFNGGSLFLTGGTGFFGCWLLESLLHARRLVGVDVRVTVLTRDAAAFARKAPHLVHQPGIELLEGEIRNFAFPAGAYSHVIHAATDAHLAAQPDSPTEAFDVVVEGSRRCLEFARQCGARRFLFTSSGAVYGVQPPELPLIPEDHPGAPDPLNSGSAYAEGKRAAELLCALYSQRFGFDVVIARAFAFVGPLLPVNQSFAAGNFLRDALVTGRVQVSGDGTPLRSYLYAADLAIWLWTLLGKGQSRRAYNVGSSQAVSILELAQEIARQVDGAEVFVAGQPRAGVASARYVPDVHRAETELGLRCWTDLPTAVAKTIRWARASRPGWLA